MGRIGIAYLVSVVYSALVISAISSQSWATFSYDDSTSSLPAHVEVGLELGGASIQVYVGPSSGTHYPPTFMEYDVLQYVAKLAIADLDSRGFFTKSQMAGSSATGLADTLIVLLVLNFFVSLIAAHHGDGHKSASYALMATGLSAAVAFGNAFILVVFFGMMPSKEDFTGALQHLQPSPGVAFPYSSSASVSIVVGYALYSFCASLVLSGVCSVLFYTGASELRKDESTGSLLQHQKDQFGHDMASPILNDNNLA